MLRQKKGSLVGEFVTTILKTQRLMERLEADGKLQEAALARLARNQLQFLLVVLEGGK